MCRGVSSVGGGDRVVGNIKYDSNMEELIRLLQLPGSMIGFKMVHDKDTDKPKGFGFVEYRDPDTAASAIRNLANSKFNGRRTKTRKRLKGVLCG